MCVGDFNEIIGSSEKLGGSNKSQAQMQLFQDVVDECDFIDLGFSGHRFTWQKHFSTGHSIREWLDRALATNDWLLRFASTKVQHLTTDSSNHYPPWINTVGLDFHNAPTWDARGIDDPTFRTVHKIKKCGKELMKWNRDHLGNVQTLLKQKRKDLIHVEKEAMQTGQNFRLQEIKKEIASMVDKEQRMWFQSSKVLWASQGNRNSKFFHYRATQRKRKNTIQRLRASIGQWITCNDEVADILVSYFQGLFTLAVGTQCEEANN